MFCSFAFSLQFADRSTDRQIDGQNEDNSSISIQLGKQKRNVSFYRRSGKKKKNKERKTRDRFVPPSLFAPLLFLFSMHQSSIRWNNDRQHIHARHSVRFIIISIFFCYIRIYFSFKTRIEKNSLHLNYTGLQCVQSV